MSAVNHMDTVRALRALHRPNVDRADEVHEACRALESMTAPWCTFPPRSSSIADALRQAEGIAATLRTMRDERGGQPNAA